MPPKKRSAKAEAAAMAKVMALLQKHGVDTTQIKQPERAEHDYRHGDAVGVFVHTPKHFVPGICKECKKAFAHNRPIRHGSIVGFCSDTCRRDNWKKTTGLPYSAVSTADVWNGDPPMIITAEQFQNLKNIVEWFTVHQATLELRQAPEISEETKSPELQSPSEQAKQSSEIPQGQDDVHTNPLFSLAMSGPEQTQDSSDLEDFFDSL